MDYDYFESVKDDVKDYIKTNIDLKAQPYENNYWLSDVSLV